MAKDVLSIFTTFLQIALENSAGAMKVKVVEYGANKSLEELFTPNVVNILESEPLISVNINKSLKIKHKTYIQ